jgi:hypothetical protein
VVAKMGVLGHRSLFGDDAGVEMSLGLGSGFGSRFAACPMCSSLVCWLLWSWSCDGAGPGGDDDE